MTEYVNNKSLLKEIHGSKRTFGSYTSPADADYDDIAILDEITIEYATSVMDRIKSTPRRRSAEPQHQIDNIHDLVFRVMTYEDVPLCDDKKTRSRALSGVGHLRVNFPPFRHYRIAADGSLIEVGRSHWRGDFETGEFSAVEGRMNNRLARLMMLLVSRYASRGNYRGYSYNSEMQSNALVQLSQVGLQFDESKGDNPFAFYTTICRNVFVRTLNLEKRNQSIRDDLLVMAGASPSYTRQGADELKRRAG